MRAESGLNYKAIFEMISLPILISDSHQNIIFANDPGLKLLELSRSDIQNLKLNEILNIKQDETSKIEETLLSDHSYYTNCLLKHKNDEYSEINLMVRGISLPLKTHLGYYIELSNPKKIAFTEKEIARLGCCTGKIAHDMSNPLAVLRIHCDNFSLLAQKNKIFTSEQVMDRVKTLSKATDRVSLKNNELKNLSQCLVDLNMNEIMTIVENNTSFNRDH